MQPLVVLSQALTVINGEHQNGVAEQAVPLKLFEQDTNLGIGKAYLARIERFPVLDMARTRREIPDKRIAYRLSA